MAFYQLKLFGGQYLVYKLPFTITNSRGPLMTFSQGILYRYRGLYCYQTGMVMQQVYLLLFRQIRRRQTLRWTTLSPVCSVIPAQPLLTGRSAFWDWMRICYQIGTHMKTRGSFSKSHVSMVLSSEIRLTECIKIIGIAKVSTLSQVSFSLSHTNKIT